MNDPMYRAKMLKLQDMIRRACVNGRSKEVAEAIAHDWNPPIQIDSTGYYHFIELDNVTVKP